MLQLGRGAVHCNCNAVIMARSDCSAAHAKVDWALGSEHVSLCHSPWHPAMCGVMKPHMVCVLCGVKLRSHVFAPPVLARGPRLRGPHQCITQPPNPQGPAGPPFPPPCYSALMATTAWVGKVRISVKGSKQAHHMIHKTRTGDGPK